MATKAKVLYNFNAETDCELTIKENEELTVTDKNVGEGWWSARNSTGQSGMIPMSYVEEIQEDEYQDVPSDDSWTDNDEDPGWGPSDWGVPTAGQPQSAATGNPEQQTNGNSHANTTPPARPQSQISETSDIATGRVKSVVGRDFIRFNRYSKVGAEDFIIGQVSKKCERVLYRISDQGSGIQWDGGMNVTLTCHVAKPEEKKKFGGMKKFVAYSITSSRQQGTVDRRYKHFDWLSLRIDEQFPCCFTPKLPEKQSAGRFEEDFVKRRQELLNIWLCEICRHPIIGPSYLVDKFLTIRTDADKQWKEYKREMEKTPYQGPGFWQAVHAPGDSRFVENGKHELKLFEEFAKGFDAANLSLANSLTKSMKVHQSPMKHEMDQIGNSFGQLAKVFQSRVIKRNSAELADATAKAAQTMKQSSDLCSTWARDATVPFLDNLWLYSGLISNVDEMIETGKQSTEKVETNTAKLGSGTPESRELKARGDTINAVLLSEADYLDQIRIPDYAKVMRNYLKSRADYHRQQMEMYEKAAANFPEYDD